MLRIANANASQEKILIKAVGARKKSLSKGEEIILTLYYLHHVPTFQLLGAIDISKIENQVKSSKLFMYAVSQMNPILEYIYNHPLINKKNYWYY
nr:hypothetical protein [Okeania sp. SIO1F9]